MNEKIEKEVIKLPPFKRICMTIGELPSSYLETMSYYEMLVWFTKYLQDTVIPTINNNAEAITEIQNLFEQLQNYVNNYFENLDVQEEINNKLDEMAEDGSLTNLIKTYVDPIYQAYEETLNQNFSHFQNEINDDISDFQTEVNTSLNNMNIKLNSIAEGTPLSASSIAEMTDTTRIYVNTSDGNWYYYDGTTWVSGGVYLSSVDSLPIYGTLISTGNYSTLLSDLNNANESMIYHLLLTSTNHPDNMPYTPNSYVDRLVVVKTSAVAITQIYFTKTDVFMRYCYNGTWNAWQNINSSRIQANERLVNSSNYSTQFTDLNNISDNKIYNLLFGANQNYPSNLPVTPSSNFETLFNIVYNANNKFQLYITKENIFIRYYNNAWYPWLSIGENYNKIYPTFIDSSNYSTLLSDLNNATSNNTYLLLFSANQNHPDNMPITPNSYIDTLIVNRAKNSTTNGYEITQTYINKTGIYTRYRYNGTWSEWTTSNIEIKVGTNEKYTSLKSAIEYAINYPYSKVYVKDGTYDLYEEFGGSTYFDNYDGSVKGITLQNNIHLIFSSNSKVTFNYPGSNTNVYEQFSPFNSGTNGGFILENLNLETSNCRYAIHDEKSSFSDIYTNKYINCIINHDSTNHGYHKCIGGGLGKSGEIVIENCYFNNPSRSSNYDIVSYHNNSISSDTQSKSHIIITGCYFKTGTMAFRYCGGSTLVSEILASNNFINHDIVIGFERPGTDVIENMNVIKFNNYINS